MVLLIGPSSTVVGGLAVDCADEFHNRAMGAGGAWDTVVKLCL